MRLIEIAREEQTVTETGPGYLLSRSENLFCSGALLLARLARLVARVKGHAQEKPASAR